MNDYIKLPRSWLDRRIVSEPDYLKAVAYLATKIDANGSVDFSSGDAKMLFGMSPRRYRTFMSLITSDKQIDKQATNKTTNIKFEYQIVTTAKRQTKRQTSDKQIDKQKQPKFIPPTEDEVKAYVLEKGYHFNPVDFIPYYEKQGWKQANGLPLVDWKAGCRYWETVWKQKHGTQFYYQLNHGTAKPTYAADGREIDQYSELEDAAISILCRSADFLASGND